MSWSERVLKAVDERKDELSRKYMTRQVDKKVFEDAMDEIARFEGRSRKRANEHQADAVDVIVAIRAVLGFAGPREEEAPQTVLVPGRKRPAMAF